MTFALKTGLSAVKPRRRFRGFTLIEIGVTLAILAVLSAVLFSVVSRSRRAADRAVCDMHLKAIALSLDAFKQEHGYFPPSLQTLIDDKYLTDTTVLSCPTDPRQAPSYAPYYAIRGPRDSGELPLLVCPFHEGQNQGVQAFIGRYTTQSQTSPAILTDATATTVEHPGKSPIAAPVGLELHGADRLRTGGEGSATITFADGSKATMLRNTDLTVIQSFLESQGSGALYTLLHQEVGTALYEVHHGSKFDVVTPTTTAGALGTKFEIRVSAKQGTYLRVTEGHVRFNTLAGEMSNTSDVTSNVEWVSAPPPPPLGPNPPGPKPAIDTGAPPAP